MSLLLIIILVVVLFGGGGELCHRHRRHRNYGGMCMPRYPSAAVLGLVLLILVVLCVSHGAHSVSSSRQFRFEPAQTSSSIRCGSSRLSFTFTRKVTASRPSTMR